MSLKKLSMPEGPVPSVYKQQKQPDEPKQLNELEDVKIYDNEGFVPNKYVNGHNFKRMPSYKKKIHNYKKKNLQHAFKFALNEVFNEYSIKDPENDLNDELLLEVLNFAEKFFIYPSNSKEREQIKRDSVVEVMKSYYRDDEKLINNSINNMWHAVKKIGFFKRNFIKVKQFFLKK